MGVCTSTINKTREKNRIVKVNNSNSLSQQTTQNTSNASLFYKGKNTSKINKEHSFILPEILCTHDNIEKYYSLNTKYLGKGASGFVCEAFSVNDPNKKYAIKRIQKSVINKNHNIFKEALFNRSIVHPNIIKCYDVFEDEIYISFVLELSEGGDLYDFIVNSPNGKLPLDLCIDIAEQMIRTIEYLHTEKKIIHRDIKPENFMILITETNEIIIKLIDFGLATSIPKNSNEILDYVGTQVYAAPEVIMRSSYNEKIDVWSMGVLLFNMLTGCEPFYSESKSEINYQIKYKKVHFNQIEDIQMRNLVMKMMERNINERVSMKEALTIIQKIKQEKNELLNS